MAKQRKAKEGTKKTIEQVLWDSANELRGNLDAAEYKSVVLGLVFLKSQQQDHRLAAEGVRTCQDALDGEATTQEVQIPARGTGERA